MASTQLRENHKTKQNTETSKIKAVEKLGQKGGGKKHDLTKTPQGPCKIAKSYFNGEKGRVMHRLNRQKGWETGYKANCKNHKSQILSESV